MSRILGAVLAGGRARRFGADKALAELDGATLIERVRRALAPQVAALVVCGRGLPGWIGLPDRPEGGHGPLAGLAAALVYGRDHDFDLVLSAPCDAPFLPADLMETLTPAPACLAPLPVVGLWPCALTSVLDAYLADGGRSMRGWADHVDAAWREAPAVVNVNTAADLARLTGARG